MAQNAKVVWTIKQPQGKTSPGWSEGWYLNGDYNDLPSVEAVGRDLLIARLALLHPNYRAESIRCTFYPLVRISRVTFFTGTGWDGQFDRADNGDIVPARGQAFDALNIKVTAGGNKTTKILLRGLGQGVIDDFQAFQNPANFNRALGIYQNTLVSRFAAIKAANNQTSQLITDVSLTNPSAPRLTLSAPDANFTAGKRVRVSGVQSIVFLNGYWTIWGTSTVDGVQTITLKPKRGAQPCRGNFSDITATVTAQTVTLQTVIALQGQYGTHRDTGRPSPLQRGRQKRRV